MLPRYFGRYCNSVRRLQYNYHIVQNCSFFLMKKSSKSSKSSERCRCVTFKNVKTEFQIFIGFYKKQSKRMFDKYFTYLTYLTFPSPCCIITRHRHHHQFPHLSENWQLQCTTFDKCYLHYRTVVVRWAQRSVPIKKGLCHSEILYSTQQ